MMKVCLSASIALLLSLLVLACASAPTDRGAASLEASLLAPCCFNGTLVTHESDLARTLRGEVEQRVAHGESTDAIRDDLVNRYGAKVLAMPSEKRFGGCLSLAALVAVGLTLLAAVRVRSWMRVPPATASAASPAKHVENDPYDARIDAELETLD